ncbi:MAG: PilW family protein [Burkholderiales bacterium]|nr:PilW family protein [Burkholderiales bacterium]
MNALTAPLRRHRAARARQQGFSLIEILIGLLIAMIGVVIMMEVLITSEARTRTTTSGTDAMSSGAVMLHMLQADLKQAGYGINSLGLLGCSVTLPIGAAVPLAPVVVNPPTALVPAGDANTDTLLVLYGNDNGQPEGNAVASTAGSDYTVQAPTAFNVNDYVVASTSAATGPCTGTLTLAQVTAVTALTITVNTVQAGATAVYNLGQSPKVVAYAVRNGSLTSCDFMASDCRVNNATNWTAVAGNIIGLRAQYGRDTNAGAMNGQVDTWDQTTPTSSCGWARTPAVRVGLLARSTQYETTIDPTTKQRVGEVVTANTPTWSGSTGTSTAPFVVNGDAYWQSYRYRVFESTAPARNIVWMGGQSGC